MNPAYASLSRESPKGWDMTRKYNCSLKFRIDTDQVGNPAERVWQTLGTDSCVADPISPL